MSVRKLLLPLLASTALTAGATFAVTAGLPGTAGAAPQQADTGNNASTQGVGLPDPSTATTDTVFLATSLAGRNEVPTPGGPAVGDPDGRAAAVLRIDGDTLYFALRWQGIAAPTKAHIHAGRKGINGGIKIDFFTGTLPGTARGVAGKVRVNDAALLQELRTDPAAFYANLHTGEFDGGAVRGQLHEVAPVDLNGVLNGAGQAALRAAMDGRQEVPTPGKRTGDPDGRAVARVGTTNGFSLNWGFTWSDVSAPTKGRLNQGAAGRNGPVVADLFTAGGGLPDSIVGLAGTTAAKPGAVLPVLLNPGAFHANLLTTEFDGGAVRGQLARDRSARPGSFVAPVLRGVQIYRCDPTSRRFVQDNVRALLQFGIRHSFVQPAPVGPPQWIAPDGSAVRAGRVVASTGNGDGNINELVLEAAQSGDDTGLLSAATQILRLNTVGGVAPSGSCDPQTQPTAEVPYEADYVFLG